MEDTGPSLSITGVCAPHARKAIKWLRNRNMLAFYRRADKSLNILVTKHGKEQSYEAMSKALAETA